MALPPTLAWVEVDLPAMTEEKQRLLDAEQPVCRLTRRSADLVDAAARAALLDEITAGSSRTLVITEGLLVYLEETVVVGLAKDLMRPPGVRWWVFDLASPGLLNLMRRSMGSHLTNAPMVFAPESGVAFFEAIGWRALDIHWLLRAAVRVRRLPWPLRPFALFPEPNPRRPGKTRWSAAVRLTKSQ
jgi:O-methyltransferase involved in polyketide biosynthesis